MGMNRFGQDDRRTEGYSMNIVDMVGFCAMVKTKSMVDGAGHGLGFVVRIRIRIKYLPR